MAAENPHSADHAHTSDCGQQGSRLTALMSVPLTPLRWLVLGCAGLAIFGMVLPFSPIPPCPMLTITGVPCPLCGMTRSARSMMRLDLSAALRYQPFGVLAFLGGLAILLLWAMPRTRTVRIIRVPVALVVALFTASWIWNIGFNPTFT